jgi:hypothetical protein
MVRRVTLTKHRNHGFMKTADTITHTRQGPSSLHPAKGFRSSVTYAQTPLLGCFGHHFSSLTGRRKMESDILYPVGKRKE